MGNSAIVAKLQLDSKDYDKKLAEAKKKTRDFSKGGGSDLAAMAGKFKALAVAVAGSKAAMDTFNAVIKSSQTIGDNYASVMEQCKSVTNEFVYAFANADFTRGIQNLKGVRDRAREAYAALDQLGNTNISYSYFAGREKANFRQGILDSKNENLAIEDRKAGLALAEASLTNLQSYAEKLGADTQDYLRKEIAKVSNLDLSYVDSDALARALLVDLSKDAAVLRQDITDRYNEYKERYVREVNFISNPWRVKDGTRRAEKNPDYNPEQASKNERALNAEYSETIQLYAILNKLSDEQLKSLADAAVAYENIRYSMGEIVTQYREAERALNTAIKKGTVGEVVRDKGGPGGGIDFTKGITKTSASSPSPMTRTRATATIEDGDAVKEYAAAMEVLDATAVSASEGLGAIGGAISGMSGLLGEGEGAWMSYVGSIVSAVGGALPALEALAAAQAAAAVTKTALNPWTVAAGVAAVGSIVAAMAAIPKFATGGVVPGNMMSGDNVLIRANSGEVVLTKTQANNIGSMLSGGMGGKVVFKIEGSTLVGVLNNHNRIAGRSYGYQSR